MSTKSGIFISGNIYLYNECFDDKSTYIQVAKSGNSKVNIDFEGFQEVTIAIPNEVMNELAIAWCQKRELQGALGGPVGKEVGGPDCDYD